MTGNKIKNLGLYLGTDLRYLLLHTSPIRNKVLHDFPLIKMTVARFLGTGSFLVTYSDGHTKETYCQLKKFIDYFNKTLFL